MARCGCSGAACNCVVQGQNGLAFTGSGSADSPYVGVAVADPDPDNILVVGPAGLLVDCAAVAACVASTTPSGETTFQDSPGIDLTRTGSGIPGDPFVVTGDLKAVTAETAAANFSRSIVTADNVWSTVTELPALTITEPGTYQVEYVARGSAVIPGSASPVSAISALTSIALARNGVIVPNSELLVALVTRGSISTDGTPAIGTHTTASGSKRVVIAAGETLTLQASRVAGGASTHTIDSAATGRTYISARRIGL